MVWCRESLLSNCFQYVLMTNVTISLSWAVVRVIMNSFVQMADISPWS